MNTKKILLPLLFIISGYSFSANAAIYKISKYGSNYNIVNKCWGVSIGSVYESSSLPDCIGKTFQSGYNTCVITSSKAGSTLTVSASCSGRISTGEMFSRASSCDSPKIINPETGLCEDPPPPPFCESSQVQTIISESSASCAVAGGKYTYECDNETESFTDNCEHPPEPAYCDSAEVSALKSEGHKACTAQGGSYSFECNNESKTFKDSCDNIPPTPPEPPVDCNDPNNSGLPECDKPHPDKCVIGSPSWPKCEPWYDEDPTSPIDPTNPPKPDPINPVPPMPVQPVGPQPPTQPGEAYNDSRVVEAIQNLNKDMNFGFSDINGALQLQTNILSNNNELIVHGLQQDLEIYENNKKLQLNNTESIVNAIGSIPTPDPFDDSGIIEAIKGIPSPTPYDDSKVLDQLQGINDKLANQAGACVPSEENNFCEGPNGLTPEYIGEMFGQLNDKMDSELSAANTSILGAVKDVVAKPPVEESTVKPFLDLNISILTSNTSCSPMDFFGHELSCEFSNKFKLIFGFILFMYTLHTVIGILMEDITPVQNSTGSKRR
ncbi:hypothetical protein [Aliivibrio fischeri]|uniref:Uncharacterized protein n=1 Tax=Aliivibrio fischeri TaxID=668 RepID=A0A844P875_ALIFS|nr:hypothetical protein [Aliivibrio fischeri]MUK51438.1 hypothetical protein [Aliivibrio fischeri]